MDNALYASMDVLDVDECNMPHVCENASMSDNPHDCDAILHESLDVVNIPNIKLFKKNAKKFQKDLGKLFCEKDNLIAKLSESNKLVEKYKKLRLCLFWVKITSGNAFPYLRVFGCAWKMHFSEMVFSWLCVGCKLISVFILPSNTIFRKIERERAE